MSEYVQKRLPKPGLYYGLAAFAKFAFTLTVCVELYYFSAYLTDVAAFSNAIVVLIMTATSIVDLVASFFISVFLSAFNLPWGKIRSWLFIVPPIVLVFYTLCFVRFSSNEMVSAIIVIIAFFISHLFWNVGEAAINSMSIVASDDPVERTTFSVWLGRGANFAILPFSVLASFLINAYGKITPTMNYAFMTATMSVLYLLGYWALFKATAYTHDKEAAAAEKAANKGNPLESLVLGFKYTFMNKDLVITIITVAACNCVNSMMSGSVYYVFAYTFADNAVMTMSVFVLLQGAAKIVGSLIIIPIFLKIFRGNKKAVYNVTLLLQGAFAILAFFAYGSTVPCIVLLLCSHFFGSVPLIIFLALFQDCTIKSEYKGGKDVSAFIMGMTVMPIKVGNAFKSIVMSAFLAAIGYTVAAASANPTAFAGSFAFLHMLLCGLICIASVVAHTLLYKLPQREVEKMLLVNNKRRALESEGMSNEEAYKKVMAEVNEG